MQPIIDNDLIAEMTGWRRDLHAHPETAFEEHRTAERVTELLHGFGLEVHRGVGETGVVGTLRSSHEEPHTAIALRADMDALHIAELNDCPHRSRNAGKMHACGHDGHTTMLLGAAKHLARSGRFRGTVHFVFQPAEENEGGGRAMIEDGLFERFPVQAVYGLHNWPGLAKGHFAVRTGPMMASLDTFEILVRGQGGHAAMPHQCTDAVIAAAEIVGALQTVTSRRLAPTDSAVVSVTQIHGGDAWNVIPEEVVIRGTTRCFSPSVQESIQQSIESLARSIAKAHGTAATVRYERRYPPLVNAPEQTAHAVEAATRTAGAQAVHTDRPPSMASEDFAFMLQAVPGAYVWLGVDDGDRLRAALHSPRFDFNDEVLGVGTEYWVRLVEARLPI